MSTISPDKKIQYIATLGLLLVSGIDLLIPSEFVIDILYLCCTLLVFRQNTKTIVAFSVAACLLVLINALFEHMTKFNLAAWSNRLISISALIATTYIAIQYRNLNKLSKLKEKEYFKAIEEMLFITSHKVRRPVANILGLTNVIDLEKNLTGEDLKDYCRHLVLSARELDDFTKELNKFLEQAGQKQKQR